MIPMMIEWIDAVSEIGWENETERPDMRVRSLGYVVHEDESVICLAADVGHDSAEDHNRRLWIPKAWITRRKALQTSSNLGSSEPRSPEGT